MSTDQTAALTSSQQVSSVNAAPALPQTPSLSFSIPSTPAPDLAQQETLRRYEERVRALMSEKDKAKLELERAVADRLELEKKLQETISTTRTVVEGATRGTQEALDLKKQTDAELARIKAENTKLNVLLQHPDLAPYAEFLPASDDPTVLEAAVTKLKNIRDAEIAKVTATVAPATSQTSSSSLPSDYVPRNNVPPAVPVRPAPNAANGATTNDAVKAKLDAAMREASLKNDSSIFERAVAEILPTAQAMARQQV